MSDDENNELVRLQRLLAMAGISSRRHSEEYITTGRVTVDGKTVTELGAKVNPETQDVRLDGERVKIARKVYYMLNKPTGILCTNRDPEGRARVTDLFPKSSERLFTVGRLDENSEGLLLVTNDGDLAHRMAHPKFRVEKIYRVQVAGVPSKEIVEQLQEGMYFSEGRFAAKAARLVKAKGHSAMLEIVLTEGQNREIRRLLAKVGHKVQRLTRVGLGPLRLGELPLGEHRRLSGEEIRDLHKLASGRTRPEGRKKPGEKAGGKPGRRPTRGAAAGRGRATGGARTSSSGRSASGGRTSGEGRYSGAARRGKPTAARRPAEGGARRPEPKKEDEFIVLRKGFQRSPATDDMAPPRSRKRDSDDGEAAPRSNRERKPAERPGRPVGRGRPGQTGSADSGPPAVKRPFSKNPPAGRKSRPPRRNEDDDLPEA